METAPFLKKETELLTFLLYRQQPRKSTVASGKIRRKSISGMSGQGKGMEKPLFLDSDEEAPIEPSDGQSVFPLKCTMRDRELAAKCVEWYAHTCAMNHFFKTFPFF